MSYALLIGKAALKALKKMPADLRQRIINKLSELSADPFAAHLDIKALTGRQNQFRLRVGDWQVIYELQNARLVILVITIAPRGGIYN